MPHSLTDLIMVSMPLVLYGEVETPCWSHLDLSSELVLFGDKAPNFVYIFNCFTVLYYTKLTNEFPEIH